MASTDNVQASIFSMTIGGSDAAYHTTIGVGGMIEKFQVKSGRTGTDVLTEIVQGRTPILEFEFIETSLVQMREWLGMAALADEAPAVGDVVPTKTVQLHPVVASNATQDYHFYAVSFGNLRETTNGQGERRIAVTGVCQRDSAGRVWRFGTPA